MMKKKFFLLCQMFVLALLIGCIPDNSATHAPRETPTQSTIFQPSPTETVFEMMEPTLTVVAEEHTPANAPQDPSQVTIKINARENQHPISPLIYGVSGADVRILDALRPTLNSWGGNPSTRYNWKIGHAWNAGRDWYYRNGNYGFLEGSASDAFLSEAQERGIAVRLAVPTLGWVAKDDDINHCSFPLADGNCGDAFGASCDNPGEIADPSLTNVRSDTASITEWMQYLKEKQFDDIQFIAMDNEPEIWGYTHYDVHPGCTTREEILDKYKAYSAAVHEVLPDAELAGPVTCCWYFYWNTPSTSRDILSNAQGDFLPWFLDQMRANDSKTGWRSLNVLDIHFYPEGVYNENTDAATAALRLRSTRSLWDETYVDESWINQPIYLIPRMQRLIEEHYPDTKLGISEWNWGADSHMNGALAIADVLGIFGRENVYFASYWRFPALNSPGFFAFRMYSNYDNKGSRFGDISVQAQSSDLDVVSSYAALESENGEMTLMLVNKDPQEQISSIVNIEGFSASQAAEQYRYTAEQPEDIVVSEISVENDGFTIQLPPYSITLIVLSPD